MVVFEDLYHNGIKVTSHADINDKEQSITYPEKPSVPQTGDETNLLLYAGIALGSAAALAGLLLRRKHSKLTDSEDDNE